VQVRSEKRPVCIVGMPKEVEARHIKTGSLRRSNKASESTTQPSQIESTILPQRKDSNFLYSPFLAKAKLAPSIRNIPVEPKADGSHYYLLGEGNNTELMEKLLERREGWYPTSKYILNKITQFFTSDGSKQDPNFRIVVLHTDKFSIICPTTRP
jgi:hypothetical protein